jgi:acyl carrier protein phosphodiesterase
MAASYHSVIASIGVHERLDTMNTTLKEVSEGQVVMNATMQRLALLIAE